MKTYLRCLGFSLLTFVSTTATAGLMGLVGDEIDAAMIRTIYSPLYGSGRICCYGLDAPFTVQNGTADQQQYSSSFLLDVNDFNFQVDYIGFGGWQDGIVLRLSDLDFDGGGLLSGLVIDTNVSGLTWSFGEDYVDLNIGGTKQNSGLYISGTFQVSNVPEPSGISLLLAAAAMFSLLKRRTTCINEVSV